ncbi:MAG: hypothetical protein D3906_17290 [Candidatus Electrothrix sp. AUS1_2]|nr:hypothetical protein [Candidatus Electrothrix sp. AUS1_2]
MRGAEDDLAAAERLFMAEKYNWCLFLLICNGKNAEVDFCPQK